MKKVLKLLLALMLVCASVLALGSCDDPVPGPQGENGKDGVTPTISISEDGFWVINGEKTNVRAEASSGSSDSENPQGLDFYLKDDGTYAVAIGNAKYLSKIVIPSTYLGKAVTEIAALGFGDDSVANTILKEITLPDSITNIGKRAFYYCRNLTSITIPDSVTSIGDQAFSDCSSLTSVTIPNSVTNIGTQAFDYCVNLTCISVDADNEYFSSLDGNLYDKNQTTLILHAAGKADTHFEIPNTVTSISDHACNVSKNLNSITIPNSVTSIGGAPFLNCFSLTTVYYTGTRYALNQINNYYEVTNGRGKLFYYSESEPTTAGNYWHYVDGVPTKW